MKERRYAFWRWCPQPERMKITRTRPTDKSWVPLVASALILSLLAVQSVQMLAPSSAVGTNYPGIYGTFPAVEPTVQTPTAMTPTSQTTVAISTDHLTVQFTFPESADPGNTVTISAITTAKANKKVNSLSAEVFIYAGKQLTKVASTTILRDQKIRSGDTWQTTLTATIPSNADRSAMIGTVTESWEETTDYYSPYYSWGYYPYYPYPYPPYPYNYTIYYVYEPSIMVTEKSSQQTIPLTYVTATTPEYEQLLAKHEQLEQDYNALVAKHNELSSKYESLKADYDQTLSKYAQLESSYNAAAAELSLYKTVTYVLVVIAVALGVALVLLNFRRHQAAPPPQPVQTPKKQTE